MCWAGTASALAGPFPPVATAPGVASFWGETYRTFSGWCYGVVAQGSPDFLEGRALACEPSQERSERL